MANQLDELKSLQRFLNLNMANLKGVPSDPQGRPFIYVGRPEEELKRPSFRIMNPTSTQMEVSKQWFKDLRSWVIMYYAKPTDRSKNWDSREDAANVGEGMANVIRRARSVPFYMFNYIYPSPILREVTGLSTALGAGTYNVQLLGEDLLGNITKLSASIGITISAGSAIDVQCPQHPMGIPLAKKIHIYLSGTPVTPAAGHRVGVVNMQNGFDPTFRITADVANGTPSGNALALASALPSASEVRYRQMKIEDPVRSEIVQDVEEDSLFNVTMRFQTTSPNILDYDHSQAIATLKVAETIH